MGFSSRSSWQTNRGGSEPELDYPSSVPLVFRVLVTWSLETSVGRSLSRSPNSGETDLVSRSLRRRRPRVEPQLSDIVLTRIPWAPFWIQLNIPGVSVCTSENGYKYVVLYLFLMGSCSIFRYFGGSRYWSDGLAAWHTRKCCQKDDKPAPGWTSGSPGWFRPSRDLQTGHPERRSR